MQASTSIQLPESSINFLRFLSYFYTMDWIAFIAIIASLLLIGFFAGIEIAFISANKLSIELNRKQGTKSGKVWGFYADRPARFIGTTLVGINLVFVVYGLLVVDMLSPIWLWIKSNLPGSFVNAVDYIKLFVETILSTLIVLFVEPFAGVKTDCNHTTAVTVEVLVLVIVRSREATDKGQIVFAVLLTEPSIVTQSAPFNTITAVALIPVIAVLGKVVFIVKVLIELAKGFALIVIGKVSLPEYKASIKLKVTGPLKQAPL